MNGLLMRAVALAGSMLMPRSSEANRRLVVADSMAHGVLRAQGTLGPKRLSGSDYLAIEAAEAKRARKNAKRLARGH